MTNARWKLLMDSDDLSLTEQEIAQGWHFCNEFDGLLVGPNSYELHCCHCLPDGHPVYDTRPPEPTEPMSIDLDIGGSWKNPMTVAQLLRLPVRVLRLTQNTPAWLEARKKFKTASETPIVLGLSPFTSPGELALVKYGNGKAFEGNEATRHGHKWEPVARRAYEKKFKCRMNPACVTKGSFMASLDGWSANRKRILEIKSPFSGTTGSTWRSAENGEVEEHYYAQIQHQLMCSGAERCDFIVLDSKSGDFNLIEVSRNEETFERIIDGWEAFEQKYR